LPFKAKGVPLNKRSKRWNSGRRKKKGALAMSGQIFTFRKYVVSKILLTCHEEIQKREMRKGKTGKVELSISLLSTPLR